MIQQKKTITSIYGDTRFFALVFRQYKAITSQMNGTTLGFMIIPCAGAPRLGVKLLGKDLLLSE